jgi:multiple sugar transport system permease protein
MVTDFTISSFGRILNRKFRKVVSTCVLAILALMFLLPLVVTITNSFMGEQEIESNYGMVASSSGVDMDTDSQEKLANLKFIPDIVTIKQYYTVLVKRTQFLIMFWNSVKLVVPIIAGQLIVASMAAYAFAKMNFPGREKIFFIYIIIMLMPFQVTLVPNYIVADKLGLIGSYLSIIFPGIFSTFGVFLLRQFMSYIPDAYSESAKVDGASHFSIYTKIILPMSKTGIAALAILVFIDNWNMVEQPLIFLQDANKQPLSIFLSNINTGERGIAFAASAIYMAPMILVFLYGENYLVEGIQMSGLKG